MPSALAVFSRPATYKPWEHRSEVCAGPAALSVGWASLMLPHPPAPQQTQGKITLPFVVCNTGSVKFQEMQRRVISGTKARLLPSSCFQNESLNLPLPLLWHSPLHTTVGMRARSDRSLQEDLFYSPATDQVALWKTLYKQRLTRLIPAPRHLQ